MPKIVDHGTYRKELLTCSFEIFAEKGYASLTMRELAKHLKVSTGTLYHYFPSKQALFDQLVDMLATQDSLSFSRLVTEARTLPERLRLVFRFLAQNESYFAKQLVVSVDAYRQMGPAMQDNASIRRNVDLYRRQTQEILGIDEELALLLINFFNGIVLERMFEGERVSLARQCDLMVDLITAYLEKTKHQQGSKWGE